MAPRITTSNIRCITVVEGNSLDGSRLTFIPSDPEDARFTPDGAIRTNDGKIDVEAYRDLMPAFAGEPAPDAHPYPDRPGVRAGEIVPRGMRTWDDQRAGNLSNNGAGWIVSRSSKVEGKKRKVVQHSNLWELADGFLLARLQRELWMLGIPVRQLHIDNIQVSSARITNTAPPKRYRLRSKTADVPWDSTSTTAGFRHAPTKKRANSSSAQDQPAQKRRMHVGRARDMDHDVAHVGSTSAVAAQSSEIARVEALPVATPTKQRSRTMQKSVRSTHKRPRQDSTGPASLQSSRKELSAPLKTPEQQLLQNDRLNTILERFRARIQLKEKERIEKEMEAANVKGSDTTVVSSEG